MNRAIEADDALLLVGLVVSWAFESTEWGGEVCLEESGEDII